MKVSQKSKKFLPPHPQVDALITNILATPTDELARLLTSIDSWKWPRSDLYAWIKVLDKFDAILEDVIREYDVDDMQVKVFTPETKDTLCEVLKFERLLLENSTNRKIFNSYDRLNSLMFTADLDVLIAALLLLLRPSQQYSSQPASAHSLHISTSRLESLAKTVPALREHGIEMLDLVGKGLKRIQDLPQEASEVNFTFYRKGEVQSEKPKDDTTVFQSSSRPHPSIQSSAPHTVHLGPLAQSSRPAMDIFADTVKSHQVPENERYELLCRIRFAQALGTGREDARRKLVIARLLAIAVYAHTHTETQAQSSLFLYDTDLVNRIADLLQQDREVPVMVQMAALSALDALARYRGKMTEVLSAVNAGVNHGILMSSLRKTVSDISNAESTLPNLFVDALVSFITYIASHAGGGNMVVGAGLVPVLIQIIAITHEQRLPIVSKSMQLVDNVLYGFMNAFTVFCNSRGVETLTERIRFEVDLAIEEYGTNGTAQSASNAYGLMPFARAGVLKHLLRSIHRMMQSSGTTEGMRGLIDSSLLKSVQSIIEYRGVFGPTVLPLAINVVATFVHNEPTSLTAIQEAKLPETIYRALEAGIEPSFEVIQSIPNALGALCLNQTGQDQLTSRPSIIPALFSVFTSETHLKVLLEKENAVSIGSTFDELIRHHPWLKNIVFDSLISTLKKIEELGANYVPPSDIRHYYSLSLNTEGPVATSEDVEMEDIQRSSESVAGPSMNGETASQAEDTQSKSHDNLIINYVDAFGRFFEGLFQHPSHCRDFIQTTDGLSCFARLLSLSCLPYDYANAVHSDSIVQVVRTMVEVAPAETLDHLAKQVSASLDETKEFWQAPNSESKLLPFVEIQDEEELSKANAFFHKLVTLHVRITLLSDVYSTSGFTHGRQAVGLLQNTSEDIIPRLGALHRACIWENIVLKRGLASKGVAGIPSLPTSTEEPALPSLEGSSSSTSETVHNGQHPTSPSQPSKDSQKKNDTPRDRNAIALKHVASQIPNALGPFFQAVSKMLLHYRRTPGPGEELKKQAAALSATLADVMHKHLTEYTSGDPTFLYAYHTVMIGLITFLLFDERSAQTNYHAVLLLQFRKIGGLNAVLKTCRRYVDAISRISEVKETDRTESDQQELVHVYGGLKMALHLLYLMISFKPAVDSGQIASYISGNKPETHPDFYQPNDFLVKMRLEISPLIRDIWQSPWLVSAPPAVCKYVIQCVQEIIAGENEVPRADFSSSEVLPSSGQGLLRPSQPPSEDRIRQLTDMGFPRAAAIRALSRTNNNVSFATEYLLTHPFEPEEQVAPIQPAPVETGHFQEPSSDDGQGQAETAMETEDAPAPTEIETQAQESAPVEPYEPQKTMEERKQELEEIRKSFVTDIGPLALRLADAHGTLIFDVRHVLIGPGDNYQPEAIRCVINDIERFSPDAYDVQEDPLAVRCRLLALMLAEAPKTVLEIAGEEKNLMDMLHALLLSQPVGPDKDQPLPKWLPALLLAMESLLVTSEVPRPASLVLADQPVDIPPLLVGPAYTEARSTLFELCIRLLKIPTLPRDELLATLRMLIQLTRAHNLAVQFVHRGGVELLLQRLKGSSNNASVTSFQSHIAIILRHLVEDRSVLESIMKQEVKNLLSTSRSKVTEVLTFVRSSATIAARDPQVFLEVTKELCCLVRPDVPNSQITLKSNAPSTETNSSTEKPTEETSSMQIDTPVPTTPSTSTEVLETIIHFMLGELFRVGKLASDGLAANISKERTNAPATALSPQSTTSDKKDSTSSPLENATTNGKEDDSQKVQDAHFYACFLMQSLSELLFSYEHCKFAFLTYPKKRVQTPAKDVFSRSKCAALSFLLTELVSFGPFNADAKFDSRKRMILCNWAMSVIVALCVEGSPSRETQEAQHGSPDVASIRKLVIESISRSIKDAITSEPVDIRYGRILALAELCHRLLSVRFSSGSARSTEETPMQLAKLMLEKNYVATLTNVLAEVDLNYPNMRNLVGSVLKPLEYLTKVSIKMGRSDKGKEEVDRKSATSSSVSSEESEDEDEEDDNMDDDDREETPDLYRNSSLGMYSGEMEEAYEEEDEDEMDEDEDDVDVDYDEESPSEDSSNTEPEHETVEEAMAAEVANPPSGWDNMDEEMGDDAHEMGEDEDEDEDDNEDEGVDEEIVWQPPNAGDGQTGLLADEAEEDDLEDNGMVDGDAQAGDEDEGDIFSGLGGEIGELGSVDDLVQESDNPFDPSRASRSMRTGTRLFFGGGINVPGRNLDPDMQIIGRPRYGGINSEAMTHPLLVDVSNAGNALAGQSRSVSGRRARSGTMPSNPYAEVLQTIEGLIGGEAMQLVQELMNRSGFAGAFGADIRVEVPQGGLFSDRLQMNRHGRTTISTSVRLRDPRSGENRSDGAEFGPLHTVQRWSEEAKITHGKHLQDRVQRLCNHIILALLPDARETARKEKEKEEKEQAERKAVEEAEAEKAEAERAAREAEENAAKEADARVVAEREAAEREAAEREAAGRVAVSDAAEQAAASSAPPVATVSDEQVLADEDAEMVDATITVDNATEVHEDSGQSPANANVSSTGEGSSAVTPERITVTVNGNVVDITDTGIDPTFLEALPDDMREEVLNQHFREQRASRIEQPTESQISPEFLNALPPEIRAEILREERLERSRRERQQNDEAQDGANAEAADMGAADFIASLDPQLRQVVLLDSDEGILETLPSHMIAEAGIYREGLHRHRSPRTAVPPGTSATSAPRKIPPRDAIQLLDRPGIASLVRLLFFPQLSKKTILHKVLVNLCENSKSRTELFNVLLSILQEGTGDLASVDKSFSQLSVRSSKSPAHVTAKSTGKQKETSLSMSSIVSSEVPPDLVAQRCLDALTFIVGTNELSSLFFLTEHELPAGLKKTIMRKGKGKEKQAPQTYYPIVLLLSLLDRQTLIKTPSIMDSIAGLLDAVTRPLTSLKNDSKKEEPAGSTSAPTQATSSETAPAPTAEAAASAESSAAHEPEPSGSSPASVESVEEKILLANPPQIPHPALRSIVNILTVGECSGRTFQHTLALIQHLSFLPDARDVIAQELKLKAHDLMLSLSADLDVLIGALQKDERQGDLPPSVVAKFSPASSDQAKFLRVLKTIDYMYSKAEASSNSTPESQVDDRIREIYETFRFTSLWKKLSECLTVVESGDNVEHIATILLPLIESLMVVCKNVGVKSAPVLPPSSPRSPLPSEQSVDELFVSFTDEHRKILNMMVRNNPSLMSGSFSLLVQNPRVLDFDNKRNYFSQQLHKRPYPREHYSALQVNVRRARVFEDSYHAFQHKTGDQIKYGKLSVRFYGEEGVDAGGVTREWFQILARQMFNPNYALFEPCAADRQTYQPNRASEINPDHLSYFKFVGRVIGKAIYDGRLMDAHFARSLYRMLLGKRVDYRDVEWVDPDYYKSLCWILENDPTVLDLTFITEVDEFGRHEIIPLKEHGQTIPVTMENRKEYVQLAAQYRLYSSIKSQIENLLSGFYEIIPKELIAIFNEQEVELLISGTPDIDVDEWRANTEYHGYSSSDPVIVWWWRALKSFNRDERAKVLSFATGTTRVPLSGFSELQGVQGVQKFSIHRAYGETDRLPQAHTCFNQIDLPEYSSYEKLRQQLLLAINEGGEGFGFA
ncbi:hypothetical protein ACEPAG_7928 [Sanghuangporus baumii]